MKKVKGQYPQKTSINLVIREKGEFSATRLIPTVAAVVLAAACFGKFAVADRLALVSAAERTLSETRARQAALEAVAADYGDVLEEYNRYSSNWMTEGEQAVVDRIDAVDLIQAELMSAGEVKQFSISDALITVDFSGVTLEQTSRIVEKLYTHGIVSQVDVFNAATKQETGENTAVSLLITLTRGAEGGRTE